METLSQKQKSVSLIVPVYNEEGLVAPFLERVGAVLTNENYNFEYIFINDGSTDKTLENLLRLRGENPRVKIINLSRNFGKEAALAAGLKLCRTDAAILTDVDLQDPPEIIPEFLRKWEQGCEMVVGIRQQRKTDSLLKRSTAWCFYKFFNIMSKPKIPVHGGDFRLLNRAAINAFNNLPETVRFTKGLFAWIGFKTAEVYYDRAPRSTGKTKWNYFKLWRFAIDGICSFSSLPLIMWTYLGIAIAIISILWGFFIVLKVLIFGRDVPGYASIIVAVLFLNGINFISTGIIGEYLARLYIELKHRPMFIINGKYGFDDDEQ